MKTLGVLLITVFCANGAHAVLVDPMYRVRIKSACLTGLERPKTNTFCGCVGTRHFRSAKAMPNFRRADQDMRWVLGYYRAHTNAARERLRTETNNLVHYDAFIRKQCRKEMRS